MKKEGMFLFIFMFLLINISLISSAELPNLIEGNRDLPSLDDADISNKTFNVNLTQNINQTINNITNNINQFDQSLNTTDSVQFDNLTLTGNLTLGQKITFAFGEIIDNIVDGWIRVVGGLNVTDNVTADNFIGDIEADFVKIALGGGSPTIDQMQEYLDNT
ncbi:hypothetical protein LCGC14_3075260, partial [marine sediment metagenome]